MIRPDQTPHPRLPEPLAPLWNLARDLRWAWRPAVRAVFATLDPVSWEATGGNPVAVLLAVSEERLAWAAGDAAFLLQVSVIEAELGLEDGTQPAHRQALTLRQRDEHIAYFSAEFGLTEHLPIYAEASESWRATS